MPFLAINGLNVHYTQEGDWQSDKDTLLLIHGLGASTNDWEYQIPALTQYAKVLCVDLRGHGKTDKPNMPYSVALFSEDIASCIRELKLGPLHVVGHSLGGMIAFQLALDHPSIVKTLTIINSAPQVAFASLKIRLYFSLRTLNVKWFGMKKLSVSLAKTVFPKPEQTALRQIYTERLLQNVPQAYLNSLQAFQNWDVISRLKELVCPTLIISGDRDYTPVAYKQYYAQFIKNVDVVVIEDSGHLTIMDQANECNQAIIHFLMKNKDTKK